MKYSKKYKALGLDKKDFDILKKIINEPRRSFDISNEVGITRSTILFRLNRLMNKGLVEKEGKRPSIIWKATDEAYSIISVDDQKVENEIAIAGIENIEHKLKEFILSSRNKRIYFIESKDHIRYNKEKMSDSFFESVRKSGALKTIIQEGVSPESALPEILKHHGSKKFNKDKMISWSVIPDDYLDIKDTFYASGSKVLIVNLKEETLIELENESLAYVIKNHVGILSRLGRKVGFSDFIQKGLKL